MVLLLVWRKNVGVELSRVPVVRGNTYRWVNRFWHSNGAPYEYPSVHFCFTLLSISPGLPTLLIHGSGIGKHDERPPLSTFFCASDSCRHSASGPFICHDGTSFKAELHQRACNRCGRLSDDFDFDDMIFVGLHRVKALHPKLSWNRLLSWLLFVSFQQVTV